MGRVDDIFMVLAPPRSGHHAVAQWICSQYPGEMEIHNNCRFGLRDGVLQGEEREYGDEEYLFKNNGGRRGAMYTMENLTVSDFVKFKPYEFDAVAGSDIRLVFVLRDHYNWIASLVKKKMKLDEYRRQVWIETMEEAMGRSNILPSKLKETALFVSFNKWHESESYRKSLAESLGYQFNDRQKFRISEFGGGSSFSGLSRDGKSQEMDVNNRWRQMKGSHRYRRYSNDSHMAFLTEDFFGIKKAPRIMIVYPHGLGDCILATPALRALKESGVFVGIAIQERFRSSKILDACPYVDEIFYTKDVWNDFDNVETGKAEVEKELYKKSVEHAYDRFIFVWHPRGPNKIMSTAEILEVELSSLETEVFITKEDAEQAMEYFPDGPYGFVQTNTGVPSKDLPEGYGANWLRKNLGLDKVVEVGRDFRYDEISIGAQFVLMGAASGVCLPDSIFYHAACAMRKKVDLVYFARGREVYDMVRPLHPVDDNVVFKLEDL